MKIGRFQRGYWGIWVKSPRQMAFSEIPESGVLIMEKAVEGSGFLKSDKITGYFPIGMQVGQSVIPLKRIVVSRRKAGIVEVAIDHEVSGAYGANLYFSLAAIKLPFAYARAQKGKVVRESFSFPESDLKNKGLLKELNSLIAKIDIEESNLLSQHASQHPLLQNYFTQKNSGYDFLLYSKHTKLRSDSTISGEKKVETSSITRTREKKWTLFDDGESRKLVTRTFLGDKGNKKVVHMHFSIEDKDTGGQEVDSQVMRFVGDVFANKLPILSGAIHSSNDKWGATTMIANVILTDGAIDALAQVDGEELQKFASKKHSSLNLLGLFGSDGAHRQRARQAAGLLAKLKSLPRNDPQRMKIAEEILSSTALAVDGAWSGDLLGWILAKMQNLTRGKGMYYNAYFGAAPFSDNTFPSGKPYMAEYGTKIPDIEESFTSTDQSEPIDLYMKF